MMAFDDGFRALSEKDRLALLTLARRALEIYLRESRLPQEPFDEPALQGPRSVFVTLKCRRKLHGCIGVLSGGSSLGENIQHCAVSAANDPRFPPLLSDELAATRIEISVLGPPRTIDGPGDVTVGKDGLIVSRGVRRGLLLPQVAVEQRWDAGRFVEETCVKAGLPRDAWKTGATLEAFTADVFGEDESGRDAT